MKKFLSINELESTQAEEYKYIISQAFPEVIQNSVKVINCFPKVEAYFPQCQRVLIDDETNQVMGMINMIPFYLEGSVKDLPDSGWDWMIQKGIDDFEKDISPNYLGGLQIILAKNNQGKGLSGIMVNEAKRLIKDLGFLQLVIPIRPTQKHKCPTISMNTYIEIKKDGMVFDPWLRTHLTSGAKIINVCEHSMTINGDIPFWEMLLKQPLSRSGEYEVEGGLRLVTIDVEANYGEYIEPNVWIEYE